jgi:hypothetical protein
MIAGAVGGGPVPDTVAMRAVLRVGLAVLIAALAVLVGWWLGRSITCVYFDQIHRSLNY